MPLQASGAISMNDIHVELGAASGTTVSLNDTDVRALAERTSGLISMSHFYGKSADVDWTPVSGANSNIAIVTGTTTYFSSEMNGFTVEYFSHGSWLNSPVVLSDRYATVVTLQSTRNTSNNTFTLQFALSGAGTNAGWTRLKIVKADGVATNYYRTQATFLGGSGSHRWQWNGLSSHAMDGDGSVNVAGVFH